MATAQRAGKPTGYLVRSLSWGVENSPRCPKTGGAMSGGALVVIVAIFFLSFTALSLAEVLRAVRQIRLGIENNGLLLTAANEKLDRLNDKLGSVSERAPDRSAGFDPPKLVNENFDKETQEIKSLLGKLASGLAEIKAGTPKRAAQ
jgi:hypothetical protein